MIQIKQTAQGWEMEKDIDRSFYRCWEDVITDIRKRFKGESVYLREDNKLLRVRI